MLMSYYLETPYQVDIEVNNTRCKCSNSLKKQGISQYQIIDVRGTESNKARHFISIRKEQVENLKSNPSFEIRRSDQSKEKDIVCFEGDGCIICNTIISEGSFLFKGTNLENSKFLYSFIIPNFEVFRNIISKLEKSGLKPKVVRMEKYNRKGMGLTDHQEKILWIALKLGFFEFPRKIHMKELADKLGVSLSTLSETLRRGLKNMLVHHLEER